MNPIQRHFIALSQALVMCTCAFAQTTTDSYNTFVQQGKAQLEAGSDNLALRSGESAIKMADDRWEGYALVGGAFMNLKRYKECSDALAKAIDRAPDSKRPGLVGLRQQCLKAQDNSVSIKNRQSSTTVTQAEIVLWKTIEGSANPADFQSYLDQYPHGAFAVLAHRHLEESEAKAERDAAVAAKAQSDAALAANTLRLEQQREAQFGWIGIAWNDSGGWATHTGKTREEAQGLALSDCNQNSGGCKSTRPIPGGRHLCFAISGDRDNNLYLDTDPDLQGAINKVVDACLGARGSRCEVQTSGCNDNY